MNTTIFLDTTIPDTIQQALLTATNVWAITPEQAGYTLFFDDKLQLKSHGLPHRPVHCDFLTPLFLRRLQHANKHNELLLRAVTKVAANTIIDATAGFGEDALLLAYHGLNVTMIERSPIMHALLQDGIRRARQHPRFREIQLTLLYGEAHDLLPTLQPEMIYLDPMYPAQKNTALHQIKMRVARHVVGTDADIDTVFLQALYQASKRIFVKRPKHAPYLALRQPDYHYQGKTMRLDCYRAVGD